MQPSIGVTSLGSLARVAAELGERNVAVRALGHLIPGLEAETGSQSNLKEPFLPPCSHFDGLDPAGRSAEWLEAAALAAEVEHPYNGLWLTEVMGLSQNPAICEAAIFRGIGAGRRW